MAKQNKLKAEVLTAVDNLKKFEKTKPKTQSRSFITDTMMDVACVLCFATGFTTLGYVLGHLY